MPFQSALQSSVQPALFFIVLVLTIIVAPNVLKNVDQLMTMAVISLLFVMVMLTLSFSDCISQLQQYGSLGMIRMKGCFSHPNSLGHIAAFLFIEMTFCVFAKRSFLRKGIIFFLLVSLIIVFLSGSRTAMIISAVAVVRLVYGVTKNTIARPSGRLLLAAMVYGAIFCSLFLITAWSMDQATFIMRLETLQQIEIGDLQSLVGVGYLSSSNIADVKDAAGGVVDMVWVSMFYRVGLAGYVAYALLIIAAILPSKKTSPCNNLLLASFLLVIIAQGIGESYLTSVMSFVSWSIWLLLSSIRNLEVEEEERPILKHIEGPDQRTRWINES